MAPRRPRALNRVAAVTALLVVGAVVPITILSKLQRDSEVASSSQSSQARHGSRSRRSPSSKKAARHTVKASAPALCDNTRCAVEALKSRHDHLHWLGFWDEGDYRPHEIVDFANLGLVRRLEDASDGGVVGMAHILKVTDALFTCRGYETLERFRAKHSASANAPIWEDGWGADNIDAASGAAGARRPPLRLRADWRESWARLAEDAAPLVKNGSLIGFQLGDELLYNGLRFEHLAAAAALVRATFPSAVVWLNEAKAAVVPGGLDAYGRAIEPVPDASIPTDEADSSSLVPGSKRKIHQPRKMPEGLTWFSIDWYPPTPRPLHEQHPYASNDAFFAKIRKMYETRVYPRLHSHQQAVLVPASFGSDEVPGTCNRTCFDDHFSRDAVRYAHWASTDDRIAALIPYHLRFCPHCRGRRNEIGIAQLNRTRSAWKEVGRAFATPRVLQMEETEEAAIAIERVHTLKATRDESANRVRKSQEARARAIDIGGSSDNIEMALEAARRRNEAIDDSKARAREHERALSELAQARKAVSRNKAAAHVREAMLRYHVVPQRKITCSMSNIARMHESDDAYNEGDEEGSDRFELDYAETNDTASREIVRKQYDFCGS